MKRLLRSPTGMPAFTIVWLGQLVSLTGSEMTQFALALWAWQETGSATALALVVFFTTAPTILLSPVAGALVDRWNRKLVMALTDLASGLATVVLLVLYMTDTLQIWHLYAAGAFAGAFEAFQWPAFSAAISTMLPKEQYARANGMLSLAESVAAIAAPLLAGLLIAGIGIGGVMSIDIATFCIALGALLWVRIPQPATTSEGETGQGSLWKESLYGFRYIIERPSLLGLQLVFLGTNVIGGLFFAMISPMILARTGNNAEILGAVLSASGVGGVAGGFLMSTWGGPQRRVHGVLLGMVAYCALGVIPMGLGQVLSVWAVAAFVSAFCIPILNGSNQAIWQARVAPDVQGRVFATRRLIAQISFPLATLTAGPLADFLFEPAMQPGGTLAGLFGELFGTGAGAGIGLMVSLAGVIGVVIALSGYLFRVVRDAEDLLPDHTMTADQPDA